MGRRGDSRSVEGISALRLALFVGSIASAVLVACWAIGWIAFGTPLAFFRPADDAYYYLDVAAHFVHGRGMSTDGIHTTNGYHPLWMLILLPFATLTEDGSQSLVVTAQLLSCIFFGAAVAGIIATARRSGLSVFAAVSGALFLFFPPWRGIVGAVLEGGVALALLSWFAYAAQRLRDRLEAGSGDARAGLFLGVLGALAVLARLDSVWLVGVVCLAAYWWVVRCEDLAAKSRRRVATTILGPPIALLGGYVLFNVSFFGHALPISGEVKSAFPHPNLSLGHLRESVRGFLPYYLLLPISWLGLLVARTRRLRIFPLLLALTLGTSAQAAYILLFARAGTFWWHFVSLVPSGLLAIGTLVDVAVGLSVRQPLRVLAMWTISAFMAVVLVAPLPASLMKRLPDGKRAANTGWRIEAEKAADWASTHLPPGVMLAMRDGGAFGYYARQPVLDLDGVSSSYDYQDALCDGRLNDELQRSKVRFVAYHALRRLDYDHWDLPIYCTRNDRITVLRFERSDEVYRSGPYWHSHGIVAFVIWKL
jgi:hypothetical protein